jgi:hypothetical protein
VADSHELVHGRSGHVVGDDEGSGDLVDEAVVGFLLVLVHGVDGFGGIGLTVACGALLIHRYERAFSLYYLMVRDLFCKKGSPTEKNIWAPPARGFEGKEEMRDALPSWEVHT